MPVFVFDLLDLRLGFGEAIAALDLDSWWWWGGTIFEKTHGFKGTCVGG